MNFRLTGGCLAGVCCGVGGGWLGFVGWFAHLFDSLRRGSLVCGNARARPEGRVLCLFGGGVLFFEVDVFDLGSMAEQIGVCVHDIKLPA